MTTIKINTKEIVVKGHSGYGTQGNDIVCAAISTLTQATYRFLTDIGCSVTEEINETEPSYRIEFYRLNATGKEIIASYGYMVEDLEKQYPEYLRSEIDEEVR